MQYQDQNGQNPNVGYTGQNRRGANDYQEIEIRQDGQEVRRGVGGQGGGQGGGVEIKIQRNPDQGMWPRKVKSDLTRLY